MSMRKVLALDINISRLWLSISISGFGDFFSHIAVLTMLQERQGGTAAIAAWVASKTVAIIVAGPVVGVWIDKKDRKMLLVSSDLARALLVMLIPISRNASQLYAIGFLLSVFSVVSSSSMRAVLPGLATGNALMRINSLITLTSNVLQMVGPAAAGLVVSEFGFVAAYSADAVSFLVSAAIILSTSMRSATHTSASTLGRFWRLVWDGLLYVAQVGLPRALVITRVLVAIGAGMIQVVFVVFVMETMGLGTGAFGLTMSAIAIGSVVGASGLTFRKRSLDPKWLFPLGTAIVGISYIGLALNHNYYATLLILFVDGLADSCVVTAYAVLTQQCVPDHMRGRFFSTSGTLFRLAILVSSGLAGVLVSVLGTRGTLLSAGVTIAVAGVFALRTLVSTPSADITPANSSHADM